MPTVGQLESKYGPFELDIRPTVDANIVEVHLNRPSWVGLPPAWPICRQNVNEAYESGLIGKAGPIANIILEGLLPVTELVGITPGEFMYTLEKAPLFRWQKLEPAIKAVFMGVFGKPGRYMFLGQCAEQAPLRRRLGYRQKPALV